MAENNRGSNRIRDAVPPRSSEAPARSQAEDPLAELARLIGQKGAINDLGRNDRYDDEQYDSPRRFDDRSAGSSVNGPIEDRGATHARYSQRDAARESSPAMRSPLSASAPPQPNMNASRDNSGGYASSRGYREPVESEIFPSLSTDGRADSRYEDGSRYEESNRYEDNTEYEQDSHYEADSRYEHDKNRSEGGSDYQDGDYECDDQGHGHSDDHAYVDEADYEGEGYEDEASGGRRRTGFVLVATIFGLAVLGTAGAFGYRAIFGAAIAPSLPPIIKAEDGPNKIVPTANAQGSPGQADTTSADSGEKLVSREEQPVNIQPPAAPSTTPRMVSTVPVFPGSTRGIGPGSPAAAYPIAPMASGSPAFGLAPATAGVASSTPAPSPPPADTGTAAANQPAQSRATVAAPAPPASAATKKIHTVAIRSDQSDSTDATSTSSTQRAIKPAADANAPLSIVPSGGDTAPPAPPATHQRSAPARPAPVNTAAATTNDAVAAGAAGGGYAVQVASQHSEAEVQDSFRALQAKYPDVLGGRQPIIRRADLGSRGIYFRALVGPFASAEEAASMCSNLKAAGGSCLVQKN